MKRGVLVLAVISIACGRGAAQDVDPIVHEGFVEASLGDESSFGKGVGRRAIEQAIRQAHAALEFTRVRLAVRLNNDRAIACYRACGFREVGRGTKPDIRHDAVVDFMTMEKEA